ncbi:hypothetical protein ACFV24_29865 [Nocardia fluminea]|uniref:hypothetical protein n=1 Tax=Nocardia fluminea TaxID=134984 RepID=UPI00366C5808
MDYAAEIEQIASEARRRSALLMDEINEINRQTTIRAEEFSIEVGNRLRELVEQDGEDESEGESEPAASPPTREEGTRPPVRQQVPPPTVMEPDPSWTPEQLQQAEIRAAVARARAARQAQSTVTPSDGDFDSESEYYRRSTWLD